MISSFIIMFYWHKTLLWFRRKWKYKPRILGKCICWHCWEACFQNGIFAINTRTDTCPKLEKGKTVLWRFPPCISIHVDAWRWLFILNDKGSYHMYMSLSHGRFTHYAACIHSYINYFQMCGRISQIAQISKRKIYAKTTIHACYTCALNGMNYMETQCDM